VGTMQVELKKWGPHHFHLHRRRRAHRLHAADQDRPAGVRGPGRSFGSTRRGVTTNKLPSERGEGTRIGQAARRCFE
jgi:hypothetical protein